MTQILSQDEVDALLSAMSQGDVALESDPNPETVETVPFDLTSHGKALGNKFDALEAVHDIFASSLKNELSTSLRRVIEADFVSHEMVKFGEFLKVFPYPTNFMVFRMEPLPGTALMAIEPNLMFSLIDCMFGGMGKSIDKLREFTLIEQRVIKKFNVEVLGYLEKAWTVIQPIKVSLKKNETKAQFVQLVTPNDFVIAANFSIHGEGFSGNLSLCIPHLVLEPIKDKLSSKVLTEKDMEHVWENQIKDLLKTSSVTVTAELGRAKHTVGDLLSLQPGDILKLNNGPQDPITITVEEAPKYHGLPGIIKGKRAVQILNLISRNGGRNRHVNKATTAKKS